MIRPTTFTSTLAMLCALALPVFAKVSPDEFTAACAAGDKAKVEKLIVAGAKVGEPDATDRLPLLCAIFSRTAEIVELLLRKGADPNAYGMCPELKCDGHPGLPLAVRLDDAPIVKLLLAAKADVTWFQHEAAHDANVNGRAEILRLLRAAGGSEKTRPPPDRRKKLRRPER